MHLTDLQKIIHHEIDILTDSLCETITNKINTLEPTTIRIYQRISDRNYYIRKNKKLIIPRLSEKLQKIGWRPTKYRMFLGLSMPIINGKYFWLFLRISLKPIKYKGVQ